MAGRKTVPYLRKKTSLGLSLRDMQKVLPEKRLPGQILLKKKKETDMTKEEFVEVLKKEGFPAIIKDGVVYIDKALTREEVSAFREVIQREHYCESYGFRWAPGSLEQPREETAEEKPKKKSRRKARAK